MEIGADHGEIILWPRSGERSGAEIHIDRDPHQGLSKGKEETAPHRFAPARPCGTAPEPSRVVGATLLRGAPEGALPRTSPGGSVAGLAGKLDELIHAPGLALLRQRLAERLQVPAGASLGEALCAVDPLPALLHFRGVASQCRKELGDEGWVAAQKDVRRVLGLLLGRFVRAERRDPFAMEVRVGTHETAEVLWMAWIGNHEPPQFRVIADSRQGERLIGEHNVLAERLGEAGFGVTGILHELKLGLWKRLHPFTALPERFGDKEDSELKESLYYERLAIHMPGQDKGDPPVYGTLDTGLPNNALDDPEVL